MHITTEKLSQHIAKTATGQTFALSQLEHTSDDGRISYQFVLMDLDATNAWDDSCTRSFDTLEELDAAVSAWIARHGATLEEA